MSSREQFEAHMRTNPEGWDLHLLGGIYANPETQHDWEVWQASRQALEIELPGEYELPPATDYDTLTAACRQQDREAIEAAGVRVKA